MPSEKVIRFAGHDLILTGKSGMMMPIMRAIDMLEKDPNHMTDVFNASADSNRFYKFEYRDDICIHGEKHFLIAIAEKMRETETAYPGLVEPVLMLLGQMEYAFDINNRRTNGGIASESNDPDFAERYRVPSHKINHCKIYQFTEHALVVKGEQRNLVELAETLRSVESSGKELSTTLSDLVYQIEYAFDIDKVRSSDTEIPFDPDFADQYLV